MIMGGYSDDKPISKSIPSEDALNRNDMESDAFSSHKSNANPSIKFYESTFLEPSSSTIIHENMATLTQSKNSAFAHQRPQSPFLCPSTPKSVTLTETTLTPNQTHVLIKRSRVLKKKSGDSDSPPSKSGLLGTYANLVNTIVGAGIIGIPYALKESGLVIGIVLIFVVALLTETSLRLLIAAGKHVNASSYERLMEAAFGKFGFVFVLINMIIMSYGAMVCYLLIIKDTIPLLFGYDHGDTRARQHILFFSSLLVILPLSMQRDMADLSKTSTISVVFDIILVIIIAVFSPIRESVESSGGITRVLVESTIYPRTLFVGLGVLSFAFVCQDSSFIIASSLEHPSKERWGKVTRASILTCALLATIIGMTGYLGFQSYTSGNVLNNFTQLSQSSSDYTTKIAVTIARALLGSTMFFVYPLASYIVRHAIIVLVFKGRTARDGDDHTVLARSDRRIVLTVTLYITALIPALCFDDMGPVLAATGAFAGSSLSYLGPGAAYLGIHGEEFLNHVRMKWVLSHGVRALLWKYPQERSHVRGAIVPMSFDEGERTPLVNSGVDLCDEVGKESIEEESILFQCYVVFFGTSFGYHCGAQLQLLG